MFVINTEKQQNRQFTLANDNIFGTLNRNVIHLFGGQNGISFTPANSTTHTPNNLTNFNTIGATRINDITSNAIEEFMYIGNPYSSADIGNLTGGLAGSFVGNATYTNYSVTSRSIIGGTITRANQKIGEVLVVNPYIYHSWNGFTTSWSITGSVTYTIKLMDNLGNLTNVISATGTLPTGFGCSSAGYYYVKVNEVKNTGAGVIANIGDYIILETTLSFTSINAGTGVVNPAILGINTRLSGSYKDMYNRECYVSVS